MSITNPLYFALFIQYVENVKAMDFTSIGLHKLFTLSYKFSLSRVIGYYYLMESCTQARDCSLFYT